MAKMGRPKGAENKENKAIKDMIRAALSAKGGSAYFERQADENPASFMTLIGKLIPAEVNIDADIRQKFEPLIIKGISSDGAGS